MTRRRVWVARITVVAVIWVAVAVAAVEAARDADQCVTHGRHPTVRTVAGTPTWECTP
jgi:hypothetical protein